MKRAPEIGSMQWSAPDERGICSAAFDPTTRFPHGRQQWRCAVKDARPLGKSWQAEAEPLLRRWLSAKSDKRTWKSLLKIAGGARINLAGQLCDSLLEDGWIALLERREPGREYWTCQALAWRHRAALHAALNLPAPDWVLRIRDELNGAVFSHPDLALAALALQRSPAKVAQRRLGLLQALQQWIVVGRDGTRREFSIAAGSNTKSISEADWRWLAQAVELDAVGVHRHSPALWLRAPLTLHLPQAALDLCGIPDLIGLSPATLALLGGVSGSIGCWRVVENRTSFEHVARECGHADGVLWVPGHAPAWWLAAVRALLARHAAPLVIACDPDPAGMEIALTVARCWEELKLPWSPWLMDSAALLSLPKRLPLNDFDRATLVRLEARPLPHEFRDLCSAMRELDGEGEPAKGEQEGLDRLRTPMAPDELDLHAASKPANGV